ncbi:MAG: TIGR02285 family protein [Gammaproteobacteria bacterium]|nr:MAG: TIGR02285 family protein [Gammaproteobacteria bacterium]
MAARNGIKSLVTIVLFTVFCISCDKTPDPSSHEVISKEPKDLTKQVIAEKSKEHIMWNEMDFAPHFILEGPYKGMGFGDKVIPILIDVFPEYTHSRFTGNTAQSIERSKKNENICVINFIHTPEREAHFYYSKPYIFVLPNGLIIREEERLKFTKYINEEGKISLASILENPKLIFGVSGKTAYGKGVDEIIAKNKGKPHVIERYGKDLTEGLLQMLDLKRIDYMLTYPDMRGFLTKKLNIKTPLEYIPIAEMPEDYLLEAHIACTRNYLGEEVVAKVDGLIEKTDLIEKTAEYYSYWLNENDKKIFRQLFNKVVKGKVNEN